MKRPLSRFRPARLVCGMLLACVLLLSCGLTAFAAEEGSLDVAARLPDIADISPDLVQATTPPLINLPLPPFPEDMTVEDLYPADVQAIIEDGTRQIVKTYILTSEQSPADIPRDGFIRDGWWYELTDITEKRTSGTDTRSHAETVEISTDTKDLNEIIKLLTPTLDYQGDDGYCGLLTLDMASVSCEAAGYQNSSYTVTATREYPHLSANDLSLIPKTITDNGRTLELDDVTWEVQRTVNVDYEDIPDSYRAVAKYSARASRSIVTGYITTADYTGEVSRIINGDTIYTAYFSGSEIDPQPIPTDPPPPTEPPTTEPPTTEPTTIPPAPVTQSGDFPPTPFLIGLAVIVLLAGAGAAYWFLLRHNVKVYKVNDGRRVLAAKDKINAKRLTIDLTPLEGRCFVLEIDKLTAKSLNGKTLEVIYGPSYLKHKIAYEGNTYTVEADFGEGTVQAIY